MNRKKSVYALIVAALTASIAACALISAGCTSSSRLTYTTTGDPASPPSGGFAFALRASTVVLNKAGKATNTPAPSPPNPHGTTNPPAATGASTAADNFNATCERAKLPKPGDQVPSDWWRECLRGTTSSVVPMSGETVYIAIPDNSVSSKTVVTPKTSDSDPLLLNSVSLNTTSKVPNAITAGGTGAAAGFVFGPWGAVIGGVVGMGGAVLSGTGRSTTQNSGWWDAVCDGPTEYARYGRLNDVGTASLTGPITMDFKAIDDRTPKEIEEKATPDCWRTVPAIASGGYQPEQESNEQAAPSGWFYRFVENQSPPKKVTKLPPLVYKDASGNVSAHLPLQLSKEYFTAAGDKPQDTFPVAACRAVDLQITWWQELELARSHPPHAIKLVTFSVTVADPAYVQRITSPAQGTITLLPVCGGYASPGGPSSDFSDSVNNLIKQVQAVKDAETKWATPAKK
jgi:hypothetical protein